MTRSWAIIEIKSGRAVAETFRKKNAVIINSLSQTHRAIAIEKWLSSLNKKDK